jgi:hypothetical protein
MTGRASGGGIRSKAALENSRLGEVSPLEIHRMKTNISGMLLDSEGKGFLGCMIAIILIAAMVFAAVKLGPIYYANYMFEEDLKNITSQSGARFRSNDDIIQDIVSTARERKIRITEEDVKKGGIKIERYAGQLHITVKYSVPVDFLVFRKSISFESRNSSFTAS